MEKVEGGEGQEKWKKSSCAVQCIRACSCTGDKRIELIHLIELASSAASRIDCMVKVPALSSEGRRFEPRPLQL